MKTTQYKYNGCTLIYSITEDKKALVGTNQSSGGYNAVTESYASITLPSNITIGTETYAVTEIGVKAFFSYDPLKAITFPSSLVQINDNAFDLGYIEFNLAFSDSLRFIGKLAFATNTITNIVIGKYLQTIGSGAFGYSFGQTTTTVDKENPYFCSDEQHNLFDKRKRRLIQVASRLTSITIPSTVKIIDYAAFARSNITKIVVPSSVTKLGSNCFARMSELKTIIIYGNPIFSNRCMEYSNKITDIYYCGTKFVEGDHITSNLVTIYTCYGYRGTTFAKKDIVSSDQCIAFPLMYSPSCRYKNNKMILFVFFMIQICKY